MHPPPPAVWNPGQSSSTRRSHTSELPAQSLSGRCCMHCTRCLQQALFASLTLQALPLICPSLQSTIPAHSPLLLPAGRGHAVMHEACVPSCTLQGNGQGGPRSFPGFVSFECAGRHELLLSRPLAGFHVRPPAVYPEHELGIHCGWHGWHSAWAASGSPHEHHLQACNSCCATTSDPSWLLVHSTHTLGSHTPIPCSKPPRPRASCAPHAHRHLCTPLHAHA